MKPHGYALVLLASLLIASPLMACGPKGPKTDVDIRGRILEFYDDPAGMRVMDLETGRHWKFLVGETTGIQEGDRVLSLSDLKLGYHVRVRANKSATVSKAYDAVIVDLLDTGEVGKKGR